MTTQAAITALYQTIAALDDQIANLNAEREQARTTLSSLVEAEGGKVVIAGIATMEITRPAIVVSYDRAGIERIVAQLIDQNHPVIAAAIQVQRREYHRVGSLRIKKVKATTVEAAA